MKLLPFKLPALYAIADLDTLAAKNVHLRDFVEELLKAEVEILQLRHKHGSPQEILRCAAEITRLVAGTPCVPVMNDRADLAVLAGWRAVHVGHRDMPASAVRQVLQAGARLPPVVGISTHNDEQVRAAEASEADYVAIGPVYRTGTKPDAEPAVGLEGVRRAKRLTAKPLVAIGGITLENAASVRAAGADSVAVIGGLFRGDHPISATATLFKQSLRVDPPPTAGQPPSTTHEE